MFSKKFFQVTCLMICVNRKMCIWIFFFFLVEKVRAHLSNVVCIFFLNIYIYIYIYIKVKKCVGIGIMLFKN